MSDINKRDENRVTTASGISNDGNDTQLTFRLDPVTYRLLTNSTISGDIYISPESTVFNNTKTVPTGTAETVGSSQAIHSITIKSLSTNTVAVYIGTTGVTTANGFELLPGESISLDIDNVADCYCISGSAAQVIRWIAI